MRQITLLLCLLVFAALCRIVKSDKAPGTTAQDEMVLSKTEIIAKAVNTGSKAGTIDATRTYAQDASRTFHRQQGTVIAANPHSTGTIFSRSNRLVKFEFTELRIAEIVETLFPRPDLV
jgi:hypothetical protein